MGLGFIFRHYNEHFCFVLFPFFLCTFGLAVPVPCAAWGPVAPSKRGCQSRPLHLVAAICNSRQYVGLICVIIQTSWLLLWGVLSFFLKLHNAMVVSKGKVLN